ncbi:DUF3667 domain-containing protein [Pseudomarimonas arenosa]|uniref:DUF3667 domain-containing protein n=1 Tax=Pseudomarimonas arenosa TaxID=2774145 RepID=A0AAW3ZLW3_9GAMM|nr:DUF3667 domain-containing protein [Pseudomarimonas arenosa]MBD8526519.1 DUF3667 domain-containing protein [Pseudomarimonas arenosa]
MNAILCRNCGTLVADAYCPRCGQSARVGKLRLRELADQALDAVADWDGRLWKTLRGLITRPGQVCADYVDGRRQAYVPPLRFCLLALLANLLVGQLFVIEVDWSGSVSAERQEELQALFVEFRQLAADHSDWLALLGVPFLAWQYRLLMWGRQRNFAECGVFVLYITGQISVLAALLSPLKWLGAGPAGLVRFGFLLGLYYLGSRVFFDIGRPRAAMAAVLACLTTLLFSFFGLIALAAWQGKLQPFLEAFHS